MRNKHIHRKIQSFDCEQHWEIFPNSCLTFLMISVVIQQPQVSRIFLNNTRKVPQGEHAQVQTLDALLIQNPPSFLPPPPHLSLDQNHLPNHYFIHCTYVYLFLLQQMKPLHRERLNLQYSTIHHCPFMGRDHTIFIT